MEYKQKSSVKKEIPAPNKSGNDNFVGIYLNDVLKSDGIVLSEEQEREYIKQYRDNKDRRARDQLLVHNLRLVVKIASKVSNGKMELMDRIQEGNIALMHALEKYDPSKCSSFSAYAHSYITISLINKLNSKETTGVPAFFNNKRKKFEKCVEEYRSKNNEVVLSSTKKEKITLLGYINSKKPSFSFDDAMSETKNPEEYYKGISDSMYSPERLASKKELSDKLIQNISTLRHPFKYTLYNYYFLGHTLEKIGKDLKRSGRAAGSFWKIKGEQMLREKPVVKELRAYIEDPCE